MLEIWIKKYGAITGIITGVVIVTVFLVKMEANASAGNRELVKLNMKVEEMNKILDIYVVVDQGKYERWNRQENARLKRLYNKMGWEYEPIE